MQIIFILYKYKNTHKAPFIPLKQLLLLIETPCTNKSHSLIEWLIDSFILCLPVSVSVCLSVCLSVSSLLFRSVAMCSVGTMYMLQPHMKILHMQCMLMNTAVAILNKQGESRTWHNKPFSSSLKSSTFYNKAQRKYVWGEWKGVGV